MPLIKCPQCGESCFVPTTSAITRIHCPYCKHALTVRDPEPPPKPEILVFQPVEEEDPLPRRPEPKETVPGPVRGPRRRASQDGPGRQPRLAPGVARQGGSGPAPGLGIASLVIGLSQLLFCPFGSCVEFLTFPIAVAGFLLGAAGLFVSISRRNGGTALPIAALAVNAVALGIVILWTFIFAPLVIDRKPNEASARLEAAKSAAAQEWADASDGVMCGDVRVRITQARVNLVHGVRNTDPVVAQLILTLRISNISPTRKIDYRGWGLDSSGPSAVLKDDLGNTYRRIQFASGSENQDQVTKSTIYPEQTAKDLIVFEAPGLNSNWLRLELPGDNVGVAGTFRLQFSNKAVQRNQPSQPPESTSGAPIPSPAPQPPSPPPRPPTNAELMAKYREEMKAKDPAKRRSAAAELRKLGSAAADALPELTAALGDTDADIRADAAEALVALDTRAGKAYCDVLRATGDADGRVRHAAERFLQKYGQPPPHAVPRLVALAGDAKLASGVRLRALAALARFQPNSQVVVPLYLASLQSPDEAIREQAAKCLAGLGKTSDRAVLPALLAAVSDPARSVRDSASDALARIGPPEQYDLPALVEGLRSESSAIRTRALQCLRRMGKNASDAAAQVSALLKDPEASVRLAALDCLLVIAPQRYGDAAILLVDQDREVRKAAAASLRTLNPAKRFEILTDALSASAEASRRDAAIALDQVQLQSADDVPTRAKVRLSAALADPNPTVRLKAAKALHKLDWDSAHAASVLAKLLDEHGEGIAREAAEALRGIGAAATRDAVPELLHALSSRQAATRRAAAAALRTASRLRPETRRTLIAALADDALHDDLAPILAQFGESAVADLIVALGDDKAEIRLGSVRALGLIGPDAIDAYRPLIQRYQRDPDERVKRAADKAMGLIRRKP